MNEKNGDAFFTPLESAEENMRLWDLIMKGSNGTLLPEKYESSGEVEAGKLFARTTILPKLNQEYRDEGQRADAIRRAIKNIRDNSLTALKVEYLPTCSDVLHYWGQIRTLQAELYNLTGEDE